MELNTLHIRNYRCFESIEIDLDNHLTLFVGKNGAGKSTILDAIAIAIRSFLCGIEGTASRNIHKEDAKNNFYELGGIIDSRHQFPVEITGHGICNSKKNVEWTRSLNSAEGKTTLEDAHQIIEIGEQIYIPAEQTYGRDANSILREVMGGGECPADVLSCYLISIRSSTVEKFKKRRRTAPLAVGGSK